MNVLWLGEAGCHDIHQVGGKAANLSRLAADYRVPSGFCITPTAQAQWLRITQAESSIQPVNAPALLQMVAGGYRELASRCGMEEPAVAVRSSAVEEDGLETSFAGQYDTYLNVRGPEAIVAAILKCWESASGARMVSYRAEHQLPAQNSGIGVLVQQLVPADLSGVAFSANPINHSRDEIMINASWGLGESVVSGKVTPDSLVVSKANLRVKETFIGAKGLKTVLDAQGTREIPVSKAQQQAPCLDHHQTREIAQLAIDLEGRMGWPVDLEFAYYANQLYLLQCRPITTL